MLIWEIFSKDNLVKMVVSGLPTLIIALVLPFVSIRFALKQFYSQKWWEQKSAAYANIIEIVAEYKHLSDTLFEHYTSQGELREEAISEYYARRDRAVHELQKIRVKGQFIFPNSAIIVLNSFLASIESFDQKENWVGRFDDQSGKASDCITHLRKIALHDLKIKNKSK